MSELLKYLINSSSHSPLLFWENEWLHPNSLKELLNDFHSQIVSLSTKYAHNNFKAKPENPYIWIENYVGQRNYDNNVKEMIKYLKKDLLPIDLAPHGIYEQAFLKYFERIIFKPRKPGYQLDIAPEEPFVNVLREITDFNEDGYVSRVINRDTYFSNQEYFDNKIKKSNSSLAIGDYYWGNLESLVKEYNKDGKLIGFYGECMVNPIHKDFANLENLYDSPFCRVYGFLKPYLSKNRFFSLKIVDRSPFDGTVILPRLLRKRANCSVGDKLHIEIFSNYIRDNAPVLYGTSESKELVYDEYLLWNFNNNFFLKYEFQKSHFTYEELKEIQKTSKFLNAVENYNLYRNTDEYHSVNNTTEQNIGVLSNKILTASLATLYT